MGSMLNVLNVVIFPFAFPEIRDRWDPVEEFTPNKNRVNRQSFSNLGIIMARTKKGKNPVC